MYISWCIYYDMKLKFFEMNVVSNIVCEKNFNIRGCR